MTTNLYNNEDSTEHPAPAVNEDNESNIDPSTETPVHTVYSKDTKPCTPKENYHYVDTAINTIQVFSRPRVTDDALRPDYKPVTVVLPHSQDMSRNGTCNTEVVMLNIKISTTSALKRALNNTLLHNREYVSGGNLPEQYIRDRKTNGHVVEVTKVSAQWPKLGAIQPVHLHDGNVAAVLRQLSEGHGSGVLIVELD
ncbi:hypothetical protein MMC13_001398 [Lambiella insularis]|nr:hypothetical protein [Lambiella insularis]